MSQGGNARPPDSDLGSTFFMPTIESPEMLDLTNEEEAIVRPLHHSILMKEHCFEVSLHFLFVNNISFAILGSFTQAFYV